MVPNVRIPKALSPEEAASFLPYRTDEDLVFANVIFEGRSHVARVPVSTGPGAGVKVFFVKDFFKYPAAHGALLFEFESPVHIRAQTVFGKPPVQKMKYLLYGITGILPVGDNMSLEEAFWRGDRRLLIARTLEAFPSLESFVKKEDPRRRLELFPLPVNSKEAIEILLAGLRRAARRGYRDFFSGLNQNCIHDTFQVIDIGLGFRTENGEAGSRSPAGGDVSSLWGQFQTRFPFLVQSLLKSRGLWLDGHSRVLVLRKGSW